MLEKWLEYFYKYGHIYEFLEKEEKPEEEIKRYLVKKLGIPESTARYQMQVALQKEVGIVIEIGGWYRMNPRAIDELIQYFVLFREKKLFVMTEGQLQVKDTAVRNWENKYYQLLYQKLEMEVKYHEAKIEQYSRLTFDSRYYDCEKRHRSKLSEVKRDLEKVKTELQRRGEGVD